jgi:hypothetical protein
MGMHRHCRHKPRWKTRAFLDGQTEVGTEHKYFVMEVWMCSLQASSTYAFTCRLNRPSFEIDGVDDNAALIFPPGWTAATSDGCSVLVPSGAVSVVCSQDSQPLLRTMGTYQYHTSEDTSVKRS